MLHLRVQPVAVLLSLMIIGLFRPAVAQTPDESPGLAQIAREEVLNSPAWRRAMFEVNEWLTTQSVYAPEEVAEMRERFRQRVDEMNADELKLLLEDLQAKLQLLETPQAREARAWMAEYVSVMSDQKREQVLSDLPDLATMNSQQLRQALLRIKQKRAQMDALQLGRGSGQAARVASQMRANQATQARLERGASSRAATFSPYRTPSTVNDRLNVPPPRPTFFVDAWGGVGRTLPGGW